MRRRVAVLIGLALALTACNRGGSSSGGASSGSGGAPAAGFESPCKGNYVDQIAAAGQEVQFMLGLVRELGTSLNLQETLSAAARRLSGTDLDETW